MNTPWELHPHLRRGRERLRRHTLCLTLHVLSFRRLTSASAIALTLRAVAGLTTVRSRRRSSTCRNPDDRQRITGQAEIKDVQAFPFRMPDAEERARND